MTIVEAVPQIVSTGPLVIGVDLSLVSSGVASSDGWVSRVRSKANGVGLHDRDNRLSAIVNLILVTIQEDRMPDLVVIEQPAYSRVGGSNHDRSGCWWLLVHELITYRIPVAEVPPTCRSKWITGRGNCSKDEALAATIRRFPEFDVDGNDVADSLVLCAMGRARLGFPLASMPADRAAVLEKIKWPSEGKTDGRSDLS